MSPDTRQHRGAHQKDHRLFAPEQVPALRSAVGDLSWLLTHGYAITSALKLVGDRYTLDERQRIVVARASCSDQSLARRSATCLPMEALRGEEVVVDGFNLVVTVEAGLGGGLLFWCRDGCVRDLSSVHGSYRHVMETDDALLLVGETLAAMGPASVRWLLDRPVSNSGRLAERIRGAADAHGWPWQVEVVMDPDHELPRSPAIAVTSDGPVLDRLERWANVAGHLVATGALAGRVLDMRPPGSSPAPTIAAKQSTSQARERLGEG